MISIKNLYPAYPPQNPLGIFQILYLRINNIKVVSIFYPHLLHYHLPINTSFTFFTSPIIDSYFILRDFISAISFSQLSLSTSSRSQSSAYLFSSLLCCIICAFKYSFSSCNEAFRFRNISIFLSISIQSPHIKRSAAQ